jgi:predicted NAD/FAD-dependent oxidoreductase
VVGAGLAGLSAARLLRATGDVVVLDKGRGVGGRLATRRIGAATLDHGAQFFTTHTAEFADVVAGWSEAGLAEPWFHGRIGPTGIADADGHTRFRGVASMNAIARHLADGLDVRRSTTVTAVAQDGDAWSVVAGDTEFHADAVLLTAPVPQSLALLTAGEVRLSEADRRSLEAIEYEPCLAVLAVLDGPAGLPEPGAVDPVDGPIDWMADNQRKGVSKLPAVTIHATPAFSREHWDTDAEVVIDLLLAAAQLQTAARRDDTQLHRWRYARPVAVHPQRCLLAADVPPLCFAGDAFGGAKVEGAVLSGRAAAALLARC